MKLVSLGGICLYAGDIKALEARGLSLSLYDETPCDEQEIVARMDDADIIISALCTLSRGIIEANKNLKMIALATTGCDGVDLQAALEHDIVVTYTPGYATESVAEHTIGLMLAAGRLAFKARDDLRSGLYNPCLYEGKQLRGKKLGIIGYGRIGRRVAEIAQVGFGMQVHWTDQETPRSEFEQVLRESDFLSLHVPLLKKTRGMMGEREFFLLKDGVVLLNTSRGAIIDERALIAHLENGKIFAAGLDVLSAEPMDPGSPLLQFPNVIVTPHIAYNADVSLENCSRIVRENIIRFLDGVPQNLAC